MRARLHTERCVCALCIRLCHTVSVLCVRHTLCVLFFIMCVVCTLCVVRSSSGVVCVRCVALSPLCVLCIRCVSFCRHRVCCAYVVCSVSVLSSLSARCFLYCGLCSYVGYTFLVPLRSYVVHTLFIVIYTLLGPCILGNRGGITRIFSCFCPLRIQKQGKYQ